MRVLAGIMRLVAEAEASVPETEVFYTFTWGRNARPQRQGGKPRGSGKPKGKGQPRAKGKPQGKGGQNFSARPPRKEKAIDPDNPFAAALSGLKSGD